jgi:hypothetical protein
MVAVMPAKNRCIYEQKYAQRRKDQRRVGIVSKGISEPVDRLTLFGEASVHLFARMAYIPNR